MSDSADLDFLFQDVASMKRILQKLEREIEHLRSYCNQLADKLLENQDDRTKGETIPSNIEGSKKA